MKRTQVYGIATYDSLFKWVLSADSIRPSFFHAFIPVSLCNNIGPSAIVEPRGFCKAKITRRGPGRAEYSPKL